MSGFVPNASYTEMNEVQKVKEGPLEVAPGLSYRLSGQGVAHKTTQDKNVTPKWRPHAFQVGVIYDREKVSFQRAESSWT